MSVAVESHTRIGKVAAAEWDGVVAAADAPVFYRHRFLTAYEAAPLQPVEEFVYLVAREQGTGRPRAVLPLYLIPWNDPLGVLAPLVPEERRRRLLLTHVWHWYDTRLPAVDLDEELVAALCEEIRTVGRDAGAETFAFVNVADERRLVQLLERAGAVVVPRERRFLLPLERFGSLEGYLASLSSSARKNLGRYARRARDAAVEIRIDEPPVEDVADVVVLCRRVASKHGNEAYYPAEPLTALLENAVPELRVIRIELGGRSIAVSICFLDGRRFHTWAGGADYGAGDRFSPNYVLFNEEVRLAFRSGCAVLEGGRRNETFKLRYGMRPVELYACVGSA